MTDSDAVKPGEATVTAGFKGPMPPYGIWRDFLPQGMVAALFDHAVAHEATFKKTKILGGHDFTFRTSLGLREFGPLKSQLDEKILAGVPSFTSALKVRPFTPAEVELEMVVHGDGGFYKRHIDSSTSNDNVTWQRILTAVYYFHALPKAYSGGALRLFPFGGEETDTRYVDIEPEHNMLLVFPSWAPHEVRPVSCPSLRFTDSRFSINCWMRCERSRNVAIEAKPGSTA